MFAVLFKLMYCMSLSTGPQCYFSSEASGGKDLLIHHLMIVKVWLWRVLKG